MLKYCLVFGVFILIKKIVCFFFMLMGCCYSILYLEYFMVLGCDKIKWNLWINGI